MTTEPSLQLTKDKPPWHGEQEYYLHQDKEALLRLLHESLDRAAHWQARYREQEAAKLRLICQLDEKERQVRAERESFRRPTYCSSCIHVKDTGCICPSYKVGVGDPLLNAVTMDGQRVRDLAWNRPDDDPLAMQHNEERIAAVVAAEAARKAKA